MSVVILGHMILSFHSIAFIPLAALIVILIGSSRIYSRSRFPHQIIGSWILGVFGLYVSIHCCHMIEIHK